ncbi:hypothetical protein T484DRAFT_3630828, partial [Baffinella frigidus]
SLPLPHRGRVLAWPKWAARVPPAHLWSNFGSTPCMFPPPQRAPTVTPATPTPAAGSLEKNTTLVGVVKPSCRARLTPTRSRTPGSPTADPKGAAGCPACHPGRAASEMCLSGRGRATGTSSAKGLSRRWGARLTPTSPTPHSTASHPPPPPPPPTASRPPPPPYPASPPPPPAPPSTAPPPRTHASPPLSRGAHPPHLPPPSTSSPPPPRPPSIARRPASRRRPPPPPQDASRPWTSTTHPRTVQ